MKENASFKGRRRKRDIRDIPEFRYHLEREGLTYEQWLQRNSAATKDEITEGLSLLLKRHQMKFKRN